MDWKRSSTILVLLIGCHPGDTRSGAEPQIRISEGIFDSVFPLESQAVLRPPDTALIGVGQFASVLRGRRIAIADPAMSNIKVFASDGAFLATRGRKGRAPGEFIAPIAVAQDPSQSTVIVTDPIARRVTLYGGDSLEFIGVNQFQAPTAFRIALVLDSSRYLVAGAVDNPFIDTLLATVFDADGRVRSRMLPLPRRFRGKPYVQSEIHALAATTPHYLYLAAQGEPTIYRHLHNGELIDSLVLPYESYEGFELPDKGFPTDSGYRAHLMRYPLSRALVAVNDSTLILEVTRYSASELTFLQDEILIQWGSFPAIVSGMRCRCHVAGADRGNIAFVNGADPNQVTVEWRRLVTERARRQ